MSRSSPNEGIPNRDHPTGGPALPEKIGRYVVRRLLGKGAQGAVYQAYDPNFNIEVAIKVLHPEFRSEEFVDRIKVEAQTSVRLTATNVVRVFDFDPQHPYLVMEYCGDGDLNRYIKSRKQRKLSEILGIARQICDALVAAHEHDPPILHRDLKPGNVLFQKGIPKVADFGLAKMLGGGAGLTTTRGVMGTVRYCSPEQLRDASKVGCSADLWSLGVVLYELLCWSRPFDKSSDSFVNIALRIHTEPPSPPPYHIPDPVMAVLTRALQKEPGRRHASAREMRDSLDQALAAVPDADRILLPPDHLVDDLSRMATQVADFLDAHRSQDASTLIREIRRVAPDDSLASFWLKRLKEASETGGVVSSPVSGRVDAPPDQISSIQELINSRSFREARQKIGEILIQQPDNTSVHRLLDSVNAQERKLRAALDEAYQQADRARAAADLRRTHEIWYGVAKAYPNLPEAEAELAVATRELQIAGERGARLSAVTEAKNFREAGDLKSALKVLQSYLSRLPGDQEMDRERADLERILTERDRAEQLSGLKLEASKRLAAGDLQGALTVWELYLLQAPDSAQATREVETLRKAIFSQERERRLQQTRVDSASLVAAQDYRGAAGLWGSFLADYPKEREAEEQLKGLRRRLDEQERQAALLEVQRLTSSLAFRVESGRYRSVPRIQSAAVDTLKIGRSVQPEEIESIRAARVTLLEAARVAESGLRGELMTRRSQLQSVVEQVHSALRDSRGSGEPTAENADLALEHAAAEAVGALSDVRTPETPGDPLESLQLVHDELVKSATPFMQQREGMVVDDQRMLNGLLADSERSLKSLAPILGGPVRPGANPRVFEERLIGLRGQVSSAAPGRLAEVKRQAEILRSEIEAARVMAMIGVVEELDGLLVDARSRPLGSGSENLTKLVRRVEQLLGPDGSGQAISSEALPGLRDSLRNELESTRLSLHRRSDQVKQRWLESKRLWSDLKPPFVTSERQNAGKSVEMAGETALASSRFEEVEGCAAELEGLTRQCRIESTWRECRDDVLRIEGSHGQDGAPAPDAEPQWEDLLVRYRSAVAIGDSAAMIGLGPEIARSAREAKGERTGGGSVDVPVLGRRARRFNERFAPILLRSYEDLAAQYRESLSGRRKTEAVEIASELQGVHRKLLVPPPLWRQPAMIAITPAVLAAVALPFVPALMERFDTAPGPPEKPPFDQISPAGTSGTTVTGWVHGPALEELMLSIEGNGLEPQEITLPGSVEFSPGVPVSLTLRWSPGGVAQKEVTLRNPNELQAAINQLVADAPESPQVKALDDAVTRMTNEILEQGL